MQKLLELQNIFKNFGGVKALQGVSFSLVAGEARALIGENGAGKSTLMKITSGVYPVGSFEGDVLFKGESTTFHSPKDAEALGIAIIHQELNLFPELSVAENIFLSHMPSSKWGKINHTQLLQQTQQLLTRLNLPFTPTTLIKNLSPGQCQMVEIAKALSLKAQVLILDEPTSSLATKEIENLFGVLKQLQAEGMGLIYISHKLEEVFELCNTVTVLRDGRSVFEGELRNLNPQQIIAHMVGRELDQLYPPKRKATASHATTFELKNFSAYKISEAKLRAKNVSFKARSGEILGIAGLMGAGRTDLLLGVFGHANYKTEGEIYCQNNKIIVKAPKDAVNFGLALVTEDRKKNGLHLTFSIQENMSLAALPRLTSKGKIDYAKIEQITTELIGKLNIKIPSPQHAVSTLSGGNQQKVAIAKWLATKPHVLFLDEPTRGIDVGAKFEIYSLLGELVDSGLTIIIASSEMPEIIGLCNRVLVMHEGELSGELIDQEVTQQKIMQLALGSV